MLYALAMPKLNDVVPKPETRVAILVDNSSSMLSLSKFVVDSFNEQLDSLRKIENQKITISLVFFDDNVDVRMFNSPLEEVKNLTYDDYRPAGMTALDDATGITIDKFRSLKDWQDENLSHLCVIITDGYGNLNKEYAKATVSSMIKDLQENGWTFTYLGANQNIERVAQDYNLHLGNTMSFDASKDGMLRSSAATTRGLGNYFQARAGGQRTISSFYSANEGDIMTDTNKIGMIVDGEEKKDLTDGKGQAKVKEMYDIHMGNADLNKNAVSVKDESKK